MEKVVIATLFDVTENVKPGYALHAVVLGKEADGWGVVLGTFQ